MNQENGFWGVIPKTAKIIAVLMYIGIGSLLRFALTTDPEMQQWLEWQKDLFAFGISLFVPLYVLIVGYVFGDAKRRGMRHVMWTLIAAMMPYFVGLIIYVVVRDPLLLVCRSCGTVAQKGFAFCPKCGAALAQTCPQCGRTTERSWSHCAYCGVSLSAPTAKPPGAA